MHEEMSGHRAALEAEAKQQAHLRQQGERLHRQQVQELQAREKACEERVRVGAERHQKGHRELVRCAQALSLHHQALADERKTMLRQR